VRRNARGISRPTPCYRHRARLYTIIEFGQKTRLFEKYSLFISAIKTPTDRLLAIYTPLTNKTYVVSSIPSDDTADLSLQSALLLLRKKLKTYNGLYVPAIITDEGAVFIE
jgi:hypothetical protein